MSKNYFAIERNGRCWSPVILHSKDGSDDFANFMEMTYDEMKSNEYLDEFIVTAMEATNEASGTGDDQTVVTLVSEDGVFIWGILMGVGENDGDINYSLIDWKKDGKNYRYEL